MTLSKKKYELNKNFKHDLIAGAVREERVGEILQNKPIEVKTEMGKWADTGNIAIEVSFDGKKSGLAKTESEYWWHTLEIDGGEIAHLVFPVEKLKDVITKMKKNGTVRIVYGGDDNLAKMVLVPLKELFQKDNVT